MVTDPEEETVERTERATIRHDWLRREVLKTAGAGAAAAAVGAGSAAAASKPYDGPFRRTYDAAPVSTETVDRVTTTVGDDAEGEGEGRIREVPKKAPESDDTRSSGKEPVQKSVEEGGLVETDFDGLGAIDVRGVVPSDAQLAAGPAHLVEAINSRWAILGKDGTRQFEITLDDWFQNVSPMIYEAGDTYPAGFFEDYIIFDPRARYDRDAGRFVLACVDYNLNTGEAGLLLSVSDDSNPHGTWYNYRAPPIPQQAGETGLVDYPELGLDGDAIYLTQNFFSPSFTQATMVAFDKAAAYAGETVAANHFTDLRNPDGSLAFTVQPATIETGDGPGFFANTRYFQGQTVTVWTLSDPTSTDPTLTNDAVRVSPYSNAPNAEQPNTEEKIDAGDTRLMRVSFDGSNLWTAHTVNDGRVRWYEIDPSGPTLVQSGNFKRNGKPTFFPAVESDGDTTAMVYNRSSPRNDGAGYAGVEVASRSATTPAGELARFELVADGVDDYDYVDPDEGDAGAQTMRWGDYNGISIDPVDGSYWTVSQYASTPDAVAGQPEEIRDDFYTTRIARVDPT